MNESLANCVPGMPKPAYEELERRVRVRDAILNACGQVALCVDAERKILWINRPAAELAELTPNEAIGRSCEVFLKARHLCPVCMCESAFATGEEQQEVVGMESARKGKVYLHCSAIPVRDEHGLIIGVMRINRSPGRAIAPPEAGRNGVHSLAEKTPLAYHSLNQEGKLVDVNPAWLHLLGFRRQEVIGRRLVNFMPASRRGHFKKYFALLRRGGRISNGQLVLIAKNGAAVPVLSKERVVFGVEGSFLQTHCLLYHPDSDPGTSPVGGSRPTARGDFLPICSSCKDIRDSDGNWHRLESWFGRHLGVKFTHSLCPCCQKRLYPETISP